MFCENQTCSRATLVSLWSLSLWCGVTFELARTTLSALWVCGAVLILIVKAEILARRSAIESLHRDLARETSYKDVVQRALIEIFFQRFCQEVSYRDLANKALTESLCRDFLKRSCQETSCKKLVRRHCIEICWDLAKRALIDSLYRDLIKRPCQEIPYRELVQRSCQEKTCSKILSRGLLQGSCQESFFRDLVRRPGGREQRSCSEIYYRELEQRSSVEISCRDLVQVALQRDPAQQLLQRTCQGDIAHDLLQRSSHWELAESNRNLASLLPEATFEWTPCFGYYRVTLVLLAWSHWWFWVLSTFPFGILTAHCLGSLAKVFFQKTECVRLFSG